MDAHAPGSPIEQHIIPDLLAPELDIVFCGSAAGKVSARLGLPYAGPGNKFWPMLAETGLTPDLWEPKDYRDLLSIGIGLTDINKTQSGADADLTNDGDDPHALRDKIARYAPRILAFTAKRPAQVFLNRRVDYGLQPERIGQTRLFVLTSPSGLACKFWDPSWWHALAALR